MNSKGTQSYIYMYPSSPKCPFHPGCHITLSRIPWSIQCIHACMLSRFSHVQLFCNPINCSLPGSSVHGIFQARILERVAMPSSRGSLQLRDQTHTSCISCIGRWVLYHCTTWEVLHESTSLKYTLASAMSKN